MRINQYLARHTDHSRRSADTAVQKGRVKINNLPARPGDTVTDDDVVSLDGAVVSQREELITIIFHKPTGFVVSREGQGSHTIYDIIPPKLAHLNPVGRLDKDSSGLLLMTNDGVLAHKLTHPSFAKQKRYEVVLDRSLSQRDKHQIEAGVIIDETYLSQLELAPLAGRKNAWSVIMSEGRNRQIRRTFSAVGHKVIKLHRTNFGPYSLDGLAPREYKKLD